MRNMAVLLAILAGTLLACLPIQAGVPTVQYMLQNHKYGKCLEVADNNPANGAALVLVPCPCITTNVGDTEAASMSLQWMTWSPQDAESWISPALTSQRAQKTLAVSVDRDGKGNGNILNQWEWFGVPNQKWRLLNAKLGEGNLFQIQSVSSGRCMTAESESRIDQWDCVAAPHQMWTVVSGMTHCSG